MHKQQQLAERGAQSMLLVVLTASHGEGACVVGGVCGGRHHTVRGRVWWEASHGEEACVVGGITR